MEKVLTSIVHCSQTAYVKGFDNGLTDVHGRKQCRWNSVSADFEKAFDSNEHSFIFATLNLSVPAPSLYNGYELFLTAPRVVLYK